MNGSRFRGRRTGRRGRASTRATVKLPFLVALAATLAACASNDDDAGAASTAAQATPDAPADRSWERVVPGGG
jgi:type IV pilus biogenesis protein CpaD/CtpE